MKKFLTYSMLVVALFFSVALMCNRDVIDYELFSLNITNLQADEKPSSSENHFFLSSSDFRLPCQGNEQIRLSVSLPGSLFRMDPHSNAFRINLFSKLACQKFYTFFNSFLLQSARKQLKGYYLFHLCKLLI